ncbi:hypothetical protein AKJ16_DCAP17926, partial [Drosera capensis]
MDIALFSPSSIFVDSDDDSLGSDDVTENYVERNQSFPGMEITIREFSFHQLNANLLWPGTFAFAEWLIQLKSWIEGKRELRLFFSGHCNLISQPQTMMIKRLKRISVISAKSMDSSLPFLIL